MGSNASTSGTADKIVERTFRIQMDTIFKRPTESVYLTTLFPTPNDLDWDMDSLVDLFDNPEKILNRADDLLHPGTSSEIALLYSVWKLRRTP